jgi:hypothetical protein
MYHLPSSIARSLAAVGFAAALLTSVTAQTAQPEFPRALVYELAVTKSSWDENVGLTVEAVVIGQPTAAKIVFHFPAQHEAAGEVPPKGIARRHAISIRPGTESGAELDSAFRAHFRLAPDQTLFLKDGEYRAFSGLTLHQIASQGGNLLIEAAPVPGKLDYTHRVIYDKAAGKVEFRISAAKAVVLPKPKTPPQ